MFMWMTDEFLNRFVLCLQFRLFERHTSRFRYVVDNLHQNDEYQIKYYCNFLGLF